MINRQNAPWSPAPAPDLDWSGEAPRSRDFDDIYYSIDDGVAESRYVFLEGGEVRHRMSRSRPGRPLVIAETGFGTGLNFLLTLSYWLQHRTPGASLHYIGIDAYPLRREDAARAAARHPQLAPVAHHLLDEWPTPLKGCHRIRLPGIGVTLDLWWDDAEAVLSDLASRNRRWVDVWYLDGFAPARGGGLWTEHIFRHMARLSRAEATCTTFTAAGDVRRGLQNAGFVVQKRPGYGRKRDCLTGRLAEQPADRFDAGTPWDLNPNPQRPGHVLVLGAGLAGSWTARALADRGIEVTVLERNTVASGGSSNLQGLTYTRLSRRHAPLSDFALASYGFATRQYQRHLDTGLLSPENGEQCGFLQVNVDPTTADHMATALTGAEDLARWLTPEAASRQLGIECPQGGLFFPAASWLHPPAVCRERLAHPDIDLHEGCGEVSLQPTERGWCATTSAGQAFHSEVVVVATGFDLTTLPQTRWLPLQGIRGQVTHLPATPRSSQLKTAFCHDGYLPPARCGIHCLGASYGPNDTRLDERIDDHSHNLEQLAKALPALDPQCPPSGCTGHVALRCTTADYLPVAGPVPEPRRFNSVYADLGRQKTRTVVEPCPVYPGLWVLAGLGSRGLTAAPLAAELIASELLGEPPPVPRQLQQALAPARFLTRGLIRGTPLC